MVTYYIRVGRLIKIGRTTNFTDRMRQLWPDEILAIEHGDHERARHAAFRYAHAAGRDYFHAVPELLTLTKELAYGTPIPRWKPGMKKVKGRPAKSYKDRVVEAGSLSARGE